MAIKIFIEKRLLCLLMALCVLTAYAQSDDEYKMEIGAGVGLVSYQGDFNGSILKNQQPATSIILKRVFNPYMALGFQATLGTLKGSSEGLATFYSPYYNNVYTFKNKVFDLSAVYEYNFWGYGTGQDYRGARRLTPYILGGIGATYVKSNIKNTFTANIPLGLGLKYKMGERTNFSLQWAMHFSLSDGLDGVKDPYGIASAGMFKNTDSYSLLQVSITYSFAAKCRTCHNDEE
ncbi:MAG: DUF6089 family protein [Prevotella sp.]